MRDVLAKMRDCGKDVKMRDFPHDCGMVDTYEFLSSEIYLSVAILENGRHLGFSIGQSYIMDFITIEISHANFGVWITIGTIHPTDARCQTANLPQGKCYNMPQRRLAHDSCNCRKNTVYLTSSELCTMFGIYIYIYMTTSMWMSTIYY